MTIKINSYTFVLQNDKIAGANVVFTAQDGANTLSGHITLTLEECQEAGVSDTEKIKKIVRTKIAKLINTEEETNE